MKTFAAVALLAVAATAESDACKAWKAAAGLAYNCSDGKCKAKDSSQEAIVAAEASVTEQYKKACDGAVANYMAVGSLAVAAAALAF